MPDLAISDAIIPVYATCDDRVSTGYIAIAIDSSSTGVSSCSAAIWPHLQYLLNARPRKKPTAMAKQHLGFFYTLKLNFVWMVIIIIKKQTILEYGYVSLRG